VGAGLCYLQGRVMSCIIINNLPTTRCCKALLRPGATQVVLHSVEPWNLESRVYVRASHDNTLIPSPHRRDIARRTYKNFICIVSSTIIHRLPIQMLTRERSRRLRFFRGESPHPEHASSSGTSFRVYPFSCVTRRPICG